MENKQENQEFVRKGDDILNFIIAKTFARHSQLTEEEFLKEIGLADSGKSEDEAFRLAMYNLLIETTSQLLKTKSTMKLTKQLLQTYLVDEDITEKGE